MELSNRITHITGSGSDGWALFFRARAMVAAGEHVTELTIGEHDIRTDPSILNAMHESARRGHTGYASIPGIPALRAAVADRVSKQTGVPTKTENVLITPGGQAALFAAHTAVLNPGDTGLFLDPYYATYPGTIRGVGARAVALQTRAEHAFQPTERDLAEATDAKSLLVNSPNNPTGVVYSDQTIQTIARFAKDTDLWLISDEVYDTQIWEGQHRSPRALPGMVARTLVIGSMSKSHAMTGSRIGWIVGPEDVIAHLTTLATHTTYGVPGFIQDAALFALGQGPAFEAQIAAPFKRRRDQVLAQIAEQNLVRAMPSGGAMYLMLDIRATGLSGEAFAKRLLDEERIAVMPGESFGKAAAGHLRVALTQADDILAEAISCLLRFAERITP